MTSNLMICVCNFALLVLLSILLRLCIAVQMCVTIRVPWMPASAVQAIALMPDQDLNVIQQVSLLLCPAVAQ